MVKKWFIQFRNKQPPTVFIPDKFTDLAKKRLL